MSQDTGRQKVFQTTKVRTSIKSDLSWIQKMKEAENIKDRPDTSPEKELQIGKPSEPVSSEPTAANDVDLKSNDSAEVSDSRPQSQDLPSINSDTSMIFDDTDAHDNVNPSHTEEALSETKEAIVDEISTGQESKSVEVDVVAHPPSTEEESTIKAEVVVSETAAAVVDPDKSNEAEKAFNNLYNSLVEPMDHIHLDAVEAQTAPDISAVIDEPQDDTVTNTNQSTKECGTVNGEVVVSETATAVVDPDKSNEADLMLEKEMVHAKSEAESVVSEIVETKSQTETSNGTMIGKPSEPVSSEPTAANDVDLKSNDSAEVSRVDVKENCVEATFETVIVNDPTAVEGSVAHIVPDIIAESVSKSSPQENGNDLSTENAFDNLYNSLVEPIDHINLGSKKAVEAQTAPDISAVIDEPQDDTATNTNQSTKECGTVNGDVHVQNDEEAVKSEEKENEQPIGPDVFTTFTETPEDSLETTETQSLSTKLDIVECETTNGEVTEQKQSDLNAVPSDAPLADSQPQSKDLPSINGDTSMIVDDTDAQDNVNPSHTEEALSETKEAIVDEISTGQESKSVEVVVVAHPPSTEEESTIKAEVVVSETATAVVDPDKSNEADLMLDKEMVDAKSAAESVVSEIVETKSQTETSNGTMIESVDVTPKEHFVSLSKVDVQTPIETPEVIQESVEIAVQSAGDDQPAMVNVNPEETTIGTAVPVVVVPSTWGAEESGPLEKEVTEGNISEEATEIESIPLVPSVAGENQAAFDLSNALEIVPTSESKEEAGKMEITDAFDEATAVKTVKESEEPADSNGDGQEVCSHCDQFIGLVKLTIEYPPMYLHPECFTCGMCTQNLGNLLIPMFEHKHLIYCSDCYDVVYSL